MGRATQRDRKAPGHDSRHLFRVTKVDGAVSDDTIGSALRRRREELGLSRVRAAERVGMSRTTYSSYEMDAQRPSVDVFPALAAFLDISIKKFLALYSATVIAGLQPSLDAVLKVLDEATKEQGAGEDGIAEKLEGHAPPTETETVDEDTYWLGLLPPDAPSADAKGDTLSSPDAIDETLALTSSDHDENDENDEVASSDGPGGATAPTKTPESPVISSVPIAETIVRDAAAPKKKKKKKKKKKN